MPWCDDCSKYWNPSSMRPDGSCPTCGRVLPERMFGPREGEEGAGDGSVPEAPGKVSLREMAGEERTPWHFKLLVVLVVAYLVWRIIQMIGWFV
jgi:hypothetical protein